MPNFNISVSDGDAALIAKSLQTRLDELDKERDRLQTLINTLMGKGSNFPARLDSMHADAPRTSAPYSDKGTWVFKCKYILKNFGPKSTRGIYDSLVELEPRFKDDRELAIRSISSTLSQNSGEGGELSRQKNEANEWVYNIKEKTALFEAVSDDDDL